MRQLSLMMTVMLLLLQTHQSIGQRIVTNNSVFTEGDFTYEFWMDDRVPPGQTTPGTGSMTVLPNGGFGAEWSNVENILFRSGLRPGSLNQVITFETTYNPTGNTGTSYLTLYGWTREPLVEWYVVENWYNWRPPGGTPLGTFTSDGSIYDVFRTERVNQPSIDGWQTFPQFWSVRHDRRTSGTITFANHIDAWRTYGMDMGTSLYEVSFCVEGFRNSGTASVTSLVFTVGSTSSKANPDGNSLHPSVTMYPNHSADALNIRLDGYHTGELTLNIFNIKGALVQSVKNPGYRTLLDVASLDSGIYFVEVRSLEHVSNHRFVK